MSTVDRPRISVWGLGMGLTVLASSTFAQVTADVAPPQPAAPPLVMPATGAGVPSVGVMQPAEAAGAGPGAGPGAAPVAPMAAAPSSPAAPATPAVALVPTLATARVLSVTSVAQPATATRLVCTEAAEVPVPTTGAGAVAGALVGAAVGSQVGGGSGNALATAAGLVGGALLGDKAEQGGRTQAVRQCVTQSGIGPSVAYQVLYEFAGQQYTTMLPHHPGTSLQVQVNPVVPPGGGAPNAAAAAPPLPSAVTHTVVVAAPPYPYGYGGYAPHGYARYWGAPVVVGVGTVWGRPYGRWHGHGHGHRRW